jgi:hypothetical protein
MKKIFILVVSLFLTAPLFAGGAVTPHQAVVLFRLIAADGTVDHSKVEIRPYYNDGSFGIRRIAMDGREDDFVTLYKADTREYVVHDGYFVGSKTTYRSRNRIPNPLAGQGTPDGTMLGYKVNRVQVSDGVIHWIAPDLGGVFLKKVRLHPDGGQAVWQVIDLRLGEPDVAMVSEDVVEVSPKQWRQMFGILQNLPEMSECEAGNVKNREIRYWEGREDQDQEKGPVRKP